MPVEAKIASVAIIWDEKGGDAELQAFNLSERLMCEAYLQGRLETSAIDDDVWAIRW